MYLIRRSDTNDYTVLGDDANLDSVREIAKRHFGVTARIYEFSSDHYHDVAQDMHAACARRHPRWKFWRKGAPLCRSL